jgi:hypothetical protein
MSTLTKDEKLQVFNNDRSVSSYADHAQADANDAGGRFKKLQETRVTPVEYPKLPASSPWSQPDQVPTEPPLGYSIDAQD